MKFLALSLVVLLTVAAAPPHTATPAPAPPTPAAPNAGIMATIDGVLAACNANDANRVGSYFALDGTVVDEFAPYEWTGSSAGTDWWLGVKHMMSQMNATSLHATAGTITSWNASESAAYVVVPLTIVVTAHPRGSTETGFWTLTLKQAGASWMIETATWTTETRS